MDNKKFSVADDAAMNRLTEAVCKVKLQYGTLSSNKLSCIADYEDFISLCEEGRSNIQAYRQGADKKVSKNKLYGVCFQGHSQQNVRKNEAMDATEFSILDYDHIPPELIDLFRGLDFESLGILLAHITPSGEGIRLVAKRDMSLSIVDNMQLLHERLGIPHPFDPAVKDRARLSFCPLPEEILYVDRSIFDEGVRIFEDTADETTLPATSPKTANTTTPLNPDYILYNGHRVADIAKHFLAYIGMPAIGERHTKYNEMVTYIRHIVDNSPEKLVAVLPILDPDSTPQSRLSQCQAICRETRLPKMPKKLRNFLEDNGYMAAAAEEEETSLPSMPRQLPTVIEPILRNAPADFRYPMAAALAPLMGTIASQYRAVYPLDGAVHSAEFLSVIYGPSGAGKSRISTLYDMMTVNLAARDKINEKRELEYRRQVQRTPRNEAPPADPCTVIRLIGAQCSEPELKEKMRNAKEHKLLTKDDEMDGWVKGLTAAGSDKSDLIRKMFDNAEHKTQYKSEKSFYGTVKLHWNVLLTGTPNQLRRLVPNAENGLAARFCFAELRNQLFAVSPKFKPYTEEQLKEINDWLTRMDRMVYGVAVTDANYNPEDAETLCPPVTVNVDWVMPLLSKFLEEQRLMALRANDLARDSFRKRVAVKGFRWAIILQSLYPNGMTAKDKKICIKFIQWFIKNDIAELMAAFGNQYNNEVEDFDQPKPYADILKLLPEVFTSADVAAVAAQQGRKSPVKAIVCRWKKEKLIEKISATNYKKLQKK